MPSPMPTKANAILGHPRHHKEEANPRYDRVCRPTHGNPASQAGSWNEKRCL